MNLLKLQILVFIEKLKKVTDVARELDMKQPTVTFHMKSLEEDLGVALFEAKRGRILLTEAGKALYPYAVKMTAMAAEARKAVQDYTDLNKGHLHIGADSMMGTYILPPLVSGFCSQYPGIQIELSIKPTRRIRELLLGQEIDLAFYYSGQSSTDAVKALTEETIIKEEIAIIFSGTHAFAGLKSLTQQLIAQQFFVQHGEGSFMMEYARSYAAACNIHLWERAVSDSPEIIKSIVQSGDFISIFPVSGIQQELATAALKSLPLPGQAEPAVHGVLAYAEDQPRSPLREQFKQYVRQFVTNDSTNKGHSPQIT
ncbi:LysR family transcriptional regulator [Paenibacillus dokdonensis]|uniref:LysR family transcriptional regulator n=1 Tax=Paenibacillus dokdonensis TaxID=2567944 RepID=A0ABU6GIF5_9BACL|nr:LysR family transcriptional regulator [Paenibacillus dokdonensis]MEC0239159.1 LysR family transcriptional regulator [Paenibacillus dokdonensis]